MMFKGVIKRSDSRHWLGWSMCAAVVTAGCGMYFFSGVVKAKERGLYKHKQNYLDSIMLLDELDLKRVEELAAEDRRKVNELKLWLQKQEPANMPKSDDCGLEVTNIVNTALVENKLVLRESGLVKPQSDSVNSQVASSFKTMEYQFKVKGRFKNIFMFLVRESFALPSYHYRNISLSRETDGNILFSFILQVNYKDE